MRRPRALGEEALAFLLRCGKHRAPHIGGPGESSMFGGKVAAVAVATVIGVAIGAGAAMGMSPAETDALKICITRGAAQARVEACTQFLGNPGSATKDLALVHYFRSMALLDLGQGGPALVDAASALNDDPGLWPARWIRAFLLGRHRRYAEAAADWSELIQAHPVMARPYAYRAEALDNEGQSGPALADYSKVIELAGPAASADDFNERAVAHVAANELDAALADYAEALRRNEHAGFAYAGRGKVEYLRGGYEVAAADFAKAVELEPGAGYHLLWLYLAEARLGRKAEDALRRRAAGVKGWPSPIIQVLLGDARADAVPPPAGPPDWSDADRKAAADCELSFYRAEQALIRGDRPHARALFAAALAGGMTEYTEYRTARFELDRMGKQ